MTILQFRDDGAVRVTAPGRSMPSCARIRLLERPAELECHLGDVRSDPARRLVVVILPANAHAPALDAWAEACERDGRLSIIGRTGSNASPVDRDPVDRQRALLGSERGSFYARLHRSARASDVAALLGTLKAGHTALIVLPVEAIRRSALLGRLVDTVAPPRPRSSGGPVQVLHPTRRCLTWQLTAWRFAARRPPSRSGWAPASGLQQRAVPVNRSGSGSFDRSVARQQRQLCLATDALHADPLACVVIIGPRGTGKSTQLARLVPVLQAIDERHRPPLVVSAGARQASTLGRSLTGFRIEGWQALLAHRDRSVVIDEAASLPLAVLEQALERHARVVMASTAEGYEASGRAFAGRFVARLAHHRPAHLLLNAGDRFRFGDDAVERAVRRAFFLEALGATPERSVPVAADLGAVRVERAATPLAGSDRLAHGVVSLLGASHYRVSLDELDPLLDGRLDVTSARDAHGTVVGVAVTAHEGCLARELHADILARRRRLPDQLLPQLLARCAADADALGERYARITRIAVAPGWRRHGIATRLVDAVRQALPAGVALGASFADGREVERFWQRAGMLPFHRGQRVNPRSGHRSVAVLAGGSDRTRAVLARARAVLADNAGEIRDTSRDAELLARFSRGERGMAETLGALNRAWRDWCGDERATVLSAGPRLGLPADVGGRRLERALAAWARQRVPA